VSAKILNDITQSINEDRENNVYCNYNYCYIVEKLEKNISNMTADDLFNALNVVCSNDSPDSKLIITSTLILMTKKPQKSTYLKVSYRKKMKTILVFILLFIGHSIYYTITRNF